MCYLVRNEKCENGAITLFGRRAVISDLVRTILGTQGCRQDGHATSTWILHQWWLRSHVGEQFLDTRACLSA